MHPDRISSVPLYIQIVESIKEKIRSGEWVVGTRLPSQRDLAQSLGVNRSTISLAFDELAAQGLIHSAYGRGTVVINNTWGLLTQKQPTNWQALIESGSYKPNLAMIRKINDAEFAPDVVRMGTGELAPQLLPNRQTDELLRNLPASSLSLGYSEPKGDRQLREEIARYVARFGINAAPSSILIVSGALQALQLISVGLLDHGSTILLEKPSYLYSVNVFQSSGMRFAGVKLDSGGMRVDKLEALKRQYQSSIIYTIPNFHNPTGILMSRKRRQQMLSVSLQARLPIIEDDVYRELWFDSPPPPPLKAMDHAGEVIYIGSVSKALSPGLRVGWVIGPETVIDRLADIKMQSDYGSSAVSQLIVSEFLRTGTYDAHSAFVREKLKIRRDYLIGLLNQYFSDIADWKTPAGGFYIWLKIHPEINPVSLFKNALNHHILLNPGILYDRQSSQYLRLSFSYATLPQMEQAVRQLRSLILEVQKS